MLKVFDITQPKDNWEHGFAQINYGFTGLQTLTNPKTKKIPVTHINYTIDDLNASWYRGEMSWQELEHLEKQLQRYCPHDRIISDSTEHDIYVNCVDCGIDL